MLDAVERLLDQAVEGIIVIAPQTSAVAALGRACRADVPLVAVGCGTRAPLASVAIDNAAGARARDRYLLDLGHRTVHHIGRPARPGWTRRSAWRAGGRALRSAGAPEPEPMHAATGRRAPATSWAPACRAMPEVTAVFCANDPMALGLLRALAEHGRRVPEDVSVVGFDDIPEAAFFLPAADHGAPGLRRTRQAGAALLIDRIAGDREPPSRPPGRAGAHRAASATPDQARPLTASRALVNRARRQLAAAAAASTATRAAIA